MAYPIASLPGGGVLYSDGSKRYPVISSNPANSPNMSTPYGPARSTANGLVVTNKNGTQTTIQQPQQQSQPQQNSSPAPAPVVRQSLARPSAPMSTPKTALPNYQDQVNTVSATNTSFGQKLLDTLKNVTIQNNPLLKTLEQFGQLKPGSALRQGAGNFVDDMSKFGWEQLNAGQPWEDTGLSELIAGGPTRGTAKAANILEGSDSNQIIRSSNDANQNGNTNMSTNDKLKGDILGLDTQVKSGVKDFKATDTVKGDSGNDAWALVNDTYDEVNRLYMDGAISEEEAQKRIRDAELAALDQQYNKLSSNYDSLVPEYETQASNSIEDINTNVARAKELGTEQNMTNENTYGSALRKAVANAKQLTNTRRNIFSNLNTAESSAFLDAQTQADSELGRDLNTTEREKAAKIASVNKTVGDYEVDSNKEVARIKADRDAKILKVNESKRLSEADKSVERGKILSNFEADLADIQANLNTNKISQITNKQNYADQLGLIMQQGKVDEGLLNTQANIAKQAGTLAKSIPFELDNELSGFLTAPYSSPTKANTLKQKYPEWADLIDGVMSGKVSSQDYLTQTGGASKIVG